MTHAEWKKTFGSCEYKFVDAAKLRANSSGHGHVFCALELPVGKRCLFRRCPLVKKAGEAQVDVRLPRKQEVTGSRPVSGSMCGSVAQAAAHLVGIEEVAVSSTARSSRKVRR